MGAATSPGRWPRQRARGPLRCENEVESGGAEYRTPFFVPAKSVPSAAVRKVLNSTGAETLTSGGEVRYTEAKVSPPSTERWIASVLLSFAVAMARTNEGSFGSKKASRASTSATLPPARVQVHPASSERQKAKRLVARTFPSLAAE